MATIIGFSIDPFFKLMDKFETLDCLCEVASLLSQGQTFLNNMVSPWYLMYAGSIMICYNVHSYSYRICYFYIL